MQKMQSLSFAVRDYECDAAGGVNNAVYFSYFEHARYVYVRNLGWDMREMYFKENIEFVLVNANVDFRRSLMPTDEFVVESVMERASPRRLVFHQEIYIDKPRGAENAERKCAVTGKFTLTAINTKSGRSETSEYLENLLKEFPITPPASEQQTSGLLSSSN